MFLLKKLSFAFFGLGLVFLWGSANLQAVTPPPKLQELCKNSDIIVLGEYVGGMVEKPKGCEFWVTFQVKPKKFYKKTGNVDELKVLQFKKRYFVDTQGCSNIPGPNAMPGDMTEKLKKPKHDKKLFFFKEGKGNLVNIANIFWGIIDWDTAKREWHKEFKELKECHGE